MTDKITSAERSALMAKVRSRDTKPELTVRRLVHGMGHRYRLHRRDLPGAPDLVFAGLRKVIFVHGCFWHQHAGCRGGRAPSSRTEYWGPKLSGNAARDRRNRRLLKRQGWSVLTVWECEVRVSANVEQRLRSFLSPAS